jgi:glycosyltransferase A (GT-A) superfamily protein (DUF2064 family)
VETFGKDTMFIPTIGNWDTRVISSSDKLDYEALYTIWNAFWSLEQRASIFDSFLQGGYYILHHKQVSIISMNTIDWFEESLLAGKRK